MFEAKDYEMTNNEKNKNIKTVVGNITNNIGKIEMTDNQIICYVNNRKLYKYLRDNDTITFKGFTEEDKLYLQSLYGIDKPIKYIITDCNFSDIILNTMGDTFIEFNCCKFNGELQFENVNKVIFNECSLLALYNIYIGNKVEEPIDYVSFYRCIFIDTMGRKTKSYDDFMIKANNVKIKECSLSARNIEILSEKTRIFSTHLMSDHNSKIISSNLLINDSQIYSGIDLIIFSDNINSNNAIFDSLDIIMQNTNYDFNEFFNINAKNYKGFNYNGVCLIYPLYKTKSFKNITPESFELLKQRAILANTLYRVYNKCESDIKVKTNAYTRKLVNKSISDTLGE